MIVWGREDRVLPVDHAYRAAKALPGARLEVLEGCGHWPHMEEASTFNRLLVEFLSR
jgi:pimeloyl-ACP methyl ester carboxylesterase